MKHSDFKIGLEFLTAAGRWRCTDVGTRTVAAIRLDLDHDPAWYAGPPYAVVERVTRTASKTAIQHRRSEFSTIAAEPAWSRSVALLDTPRDERAPTPALPRKRERGRCGKASGHSPPCE
jgi:hypothetical protein